MDKIKFGLVGCGRIGSRHVYEISKNKNCKLTAVCDTDKEKADKIGEKYHAKSVYVLRDIFNEDIDILNICTPSGLHAEMTIAGLKNNVHVLCEKPMALSLKEADAIILAEKESKKKLFIVKQNRYNPPVKVLKDFVYKKKLGKIILINSNVLWNRNEDYYRESYWRGTMKLDGGALMTQCSHFIDLMIWVGGKVKTVFANMSNMSHPNIETEDTGIIILGFENGSIGSLQYTTSTYGKNMEGSITVLGTKGSIKVGGEYINKLEFWNVEGEKKPKLDPGKGANDYGTYKGSMSNHDKVIENVVDVLMNNAEIATNSLRGRESVEVMQACYISSKKKIQVSLPLKGEDYAFKINEEKGWFK